MKHNSEHKFVSWATEKVCNKITFWVMKNECIKTWIWNTFSCFNLCHLLSFLESHAKKSSIIRQPRPDNNLSWVSRLQALLWFILKIILLITENQNVTSHRTMNYWRQIKLLFSAEETTITPANSSLYASGRRVHVTHFERPKQLSSPLNTTSATCRRKTYLWPFLDENEGINEAYSKWYKHNP